jgi:hypothetical protein
MQTFMQKPKNRFYFRFNSHVALFYLAGLLVTACSGSTQLPTLPLATASPPPLAMVSEATADKLPAWVVAEREASIQGNLPLLATLWAVDGRIVDGRGSAEESDDYVWAGRAAILDRYQLAVFPAPPPPLTLAELADATLTVEEKSATLVNGGDRWRFVLQDGRWWLQELVYSAP